MEWTDEGGGLRWLVPIAVAAAGAGLARWLVTFAPDAAGSGIQRVEGVWNEELPAPTWRVLPVKFVGGVLALGSGLVLGREGPTVHMASVIGAVVGRRIRMPALDVRVLQVSLAGAGLAVAFNAPIGGALFVFEEVARSFRPRLVLTTFIGCAIAVACSRAMLGDGPDFIVRPPPVPSIGQLWIFVVFGVGLGFLGVVYNKVITGCLTVNDRVTRVDPVTKAVLIGAVVGTLLVIDPLSVGGGDTLTQDLVGGRDLVVTGLLGFLCVRFLAGPVSYAAGTPGGLFAPLLAIGALCGALLGPVVSTIVPSFDDAAVTLMIVGMAAFFAAVVRAPLTGLVLTIEMTAVTTLTVPLLAACFAATAVATLIRAEPIYDTLEERAIHAARTRR